MFYYVDGKYGRTAEEKCEGVPPATPLLLIFMFYLLIFYDVDDNYGTMAYSAEEKGVALATILLLFMFYEYFFIIFLSKFYK